MATRSSILGASLVAQRKRICLQHGRPGLDPLEKGMATHSSILAENSMDRGAWKATVHGVTESKRTEHLTLSLFSLFS